MSNRNFTQQEWEKFWDEADIAHTREQSLTGYLFSNEIKHPAPEYAAAVAALTYPETGTEACGMEVMGGEKGNMTLEYSKDAIKYSDNLTEYTFGSGYEAPKKEAGTAEDGKQKPSLAGIPPKVLEQVAKVMSFGAKKYYRGKWLKEPTTAFARVDSSTRHINKWLQGIDLDDESKENHLDHAICQLMMAKEYINRGIEDGR